MPGPWLSLEANPDFYKDLELQTGELYEIYLYDDGGAPQGQGLVEVTNPLEKKREGIWAQCRFVAVSDPHLFWWLEKGPGKNSQRMFKVHFCTSEVTACKKHKRNPELEFHTDYLRSVVSGDVIQNRITWFKDEVAKVDIAAEISRLAGQPPGGGQGHGAGRDVLPLGDELEAGLEGGALPEGGNLRARLARVREEVGRDEGKEKGERKAKKRRKDKETPAAAEKKEMWFGRQREEPSEDESSSSEEEEHSEEKPRASGSKAKPPKKKRVEEKEEPKKKKRKKKKKKEKGDRGPFGTGPKRPVGSTEATSISSEDEQDEGQLFRAAPSGKSKQLQLMEYAEKNPGRLASRLLQKMRLLLAREEGALNQLNGHLNLTPSTATSYYLTVVVPLHKERMNIRVQREMRTIARSLDLVASGSPERAADVLAQRLKALELMVTDQSWARAQHIELLPPEGATLVEFDEAAMATREQLAEAKMRMWKGKGQGKEPEVKGKSYDGRGKGKKGQKWSSWNVNPGEPEKQPPK